MAIKDEMGVMAGQVWRLLSTDGPQSTVQIRKKLKAKPTLVDYALGWLAREDKIDLIEEKKTLRVSLK